MAALSDEDNDALGLGPVPITVPLAIVVTETARATRLTLPATARLWRLARSLRATAGLMPIDDLAAVRLVRP